MKLWTVLLAGALVVGALDAEAARRLGGGGSMGRQSPNVTQRQATPPAPAAPTNAAQKNQAQQPAAAPGPQAAPRSRMGGILGGLAAGLGLAWLAHTLGFGEAFANILMFGLLAVVVMVVVGFIMRRRAQGAAANRPAYAYQGAGSSADTPASPRQYSPDKVGNDASARPWERNTTAFEAGRNTGGGGVRIGSALEGTRGSLEGSQNWGVPSGFDTEGFLEAAKRNFRTLQDAWDRSDIDSLRSMMTDDMMRELGTQLAKPDHQASAGGGKTDVEMLEAQLLGIEELGHEYLASVEFSGMIREDPTTGATPFREVWNMTKPKDGSAGWLVAGVQALQ